ncbi:MAG: type II secretion system protein [Rhodocyclaceae bacterium]|nr:type II secretion system protein [Rhodocyclaceae bacterium]
MRRPREAGFSLIEVLVAFSIMALALGVLYQSSSGSVRASMAAELNTRAALWGASLLDAYRTVPATDIQESGETDDGFAWHVTTVRLPEVDNANGRIALHRIDVVIQWRDRGRAQELRLASVVQEAPNVPPR